MPKATPKVRSPVKYFGGKSYLAPKIVGLMPAADSYRHYVEPFGGGASVLLARPPTGAEILNDLDSTVSTFWRVLREPTLFEKFRRRCEATDFNEQTWARVRVLLDFPDPVRYGGYDWAEHLNPDDAAVLLAWCFFVNARMTAGGGHGKGFATLTRNRLRAGMQEQVSAWLSAVDGLPQVHARMRRVLVLCRDAFELIEEFDQEDALFYLDPPYVHETRKMKGGGYSLEMTDADHERLVARVLKMKARVIISGYACPFYDQWLGAWGRHEFDVPSHASWATGGTKRRATEVCWTNY